MFNNRGTKLHSGKNSNWNELKAKSHKTEYKFFRKPEATPLKTVAKAIAVVSAVGVGAAVAVKARSKKKAKPIARATRKVAKKGAKAA